MKKTKSNGSSRIGEGDFGIKSETGEENLRIISVCRRLCHPLANKRVKSRRIGLLRSGNQLDGLMDIEYEKVTEF